jgi:hypothetical protein
VTTRQSKWAIVVIFADGERRYYGGPLSEHQWVRTRGSAFRYESEADALHHAYELKHDYNRHTNLPLRRIDEVAVEEITNPRK